MPPDANNQPIEQEKNMIVQQFPVVRRQWANEASNTDQSEGLFVTQSSDGKTITVVSDAASVPHGVVSNPDGRDGAEGNGADLILLTHPGIVQVRLNDTPGSVEVGTELALCADGTVKAAGGVAGEVVVAKSMTSNSSGHGGVLIDAILVCNPVATTASE